MAKQQLNVRIPTLTRRELDWLTAEYGMSEAQVIMLAIDLLYHRDDKISSVNKDISTGLVELIEDDQGVLDHD